MLNSNWYFTKIVVIPPVVRIDQVGSNIIESYDEYLDLFQQVRWWEFVQLFQGFGEGVFKSFTYTFKGKMEKVGDLEIFVDVNFLNTNVNNRLR